MSSPLSSLKNGKKTPLLPGRRAAPFKRREHEDALIDEQISLLKNDGNNGRTSQRQNRAMNKQDHSPAPNDMDLLSTMMQRLSKTEQSLRAYQESNREKDKKIRILEEKCKILEKARGFGDEHLADLERKCRKLQRQNLSMEKFLEDYGMVWVGDEEDSENEEEKESNINMYDELPSNQAELSSRNLVWNPSASLATPTPMRIDFDLIVKNIEELNKLAGEGEHVISHTIRGARLKVREPVPLTLYANGIFMYNGPFRPFSDPATQVCVQDIMDGYFPSELQTRYPEGVPFLENYGPYRLWFVLPISSCDHALRKLKDLRDTHFRDGRQEKFFTGTGNQLSPESLQFTDQTADKKIQTSNEKEINETSQPPGHQKQTIDQFLNKLPSSVIKNGKVVDIKSDLKTTLKGDSGKPSEVVVVETMETDASQRQERPVNVDNQNNTAANITTLRIKSEKGDKTFMLKMKYSDTIGDVKRHINRIRQQKSFNYQLKTSFPNQTYDNSKATLEECGLTPNATLHILVKR